MDSIVYTSCQTRVSNHSSYASVEKFSNKYNAFYFSCGNYCILREFNISNIFCMQIWFAYTLQLKC